MSAKKNDEFMTAQVYAEEMGVHYKTALSGLRNGLAPGAVERETPMGNYWQIPPEALQTEKPKPGPKPKAAKKAAKKSKKGAK